MGIHKIEKLQEFAGLETTLHFLFRGRGL